MQAQWKYIKTVTVILATVLFAATKEVASLQGSSSFPIQATGSIDYSNQTGGNLIINPDFSQGETGWDFHHYVSPQYIFVDTTQNHSGVASARLDPTAYIDRSIWPSYRIAVTPGQTVVASCWAMVGPHANGPAGLGARLGIDGWNALYGGSDNDVLGHATTSAYLLWSSVNTWVQLTLNYTVLPGDAAVVPWVQGFTHDANESVWVTDFQLHVY